MYDKKIQRKIKAFVGSLSWIQPYPCGISIRAWWIWNWEKTFLSTFPVLWYTSIGWFSLTLFFP